MKINDIMNSAKYLDISAQDLVASIRRLRALDMMISQTYFQIGPEMDKERKK